MRTHNRLDLTVTFINTVLIIFLVTHLLVCCWIRVNGRLSDDFQSDYIVSSYFLMATATTIGYGDVTVNKNIQPPSEQDFAYFFATLIALFSLCFVSYVQSFLTSIKDAWFCITLTNNRELSDFKHWMAYRNRQAHIPFSFETKLNSMIRFLLSKDYNSALEAENFLDRMPYNMQKELLAKVLHETITQFSYFDAMSEDMAMDIALLCTPVK